MRGGERGPEISYTHITTVIARVVDGALFSFTVMPTTPESKRYDYQNERVEKLARNFFCPNPIEEHAVLCTLGKVLSKPYRFLSNSFYTNAVGTKM